MSETKQLQPEEYSETRKKAMLELYGEEWMTKVNQFEEQTKAVSDKKELKNKVSDFIVDFLNLYFKDGNKTAVLTQTYHRVKKEAK